MSEIIETGWFSNANAPESDDPKFDSPDAFYRTMAEATQGERHQIAAVCSPLVYTDVEDKIEQLRARINDLERQMERVYDLEFQISKLLKESEGWTRKRLKRAPKSRKRS